MKRYQYLMMGFLLVGCYAVAQRQADNLSGYTQVCLSLNVLTNNRLDQSRTEAMQTHLLKLATAAGIQVQDADSCQSLAFDATSDTLKILLTLQTHMLPEGGYAYTYSLLGLLDSLDRFSSISVYRIADFGVTSENDRDAILDELMNQAFNTLAADWQSVSNTSQAMNETSRRINGPTPNGGAYAVAYFRDENGIPTTEEQAHSVEIIEYNEEDEPIHSTYGYLHP